MNLSQLSRQLLLLVLLIAFFGTMLPTHAQPDAETAQVLFQISTDKHEYHVGETAIVRLTVTNRAKEPIFISHRGLSICGSGSGFVELQLLDREDKNVRKKRCEVFVYLAPGSNLKETFRSPQSWLLLMEGESYGSETTIDLPQRKGVYRLSAELRPPSLFSPEQLRSLASDAIRILRSVHLAEPVKIVIK